MLTTMKNRNKKDLLEVVVTQQQQQQQQQQHRRRMISMMMAQGNSNSTTNTTKNTTTSSFNFTLFCSPIKMRMESSSSSLFQKQLAIVRWISSSNTNNNSNNSMGITNNYQHDQKRQQHQQQQKQQQQHVEPWSLRKLIDMNTTTSTISTVVAATDDAAADDNDDNDNNRNNNCNVSKEAKMEDKFLLFILDDYKKRLERNTNRITVLQEQIDIFHDMLLLLLSREKKKNNDNINNNTSPTLTTVSVPLIEKHKQQTKRQAEDEIIMVMTMINVLEEEQKVLRNLQRLQKDTRESISHVERMHHNNSNKCNTTIDRRKRRKQWIQFLVSTVTEIYARHSFTIEQMSELVIKLKPLNGISNSNSNSINDTTNTVEEGLQILYDTVCEYMQERMTLQLLCEHLMALLGKRNRNKMMNDSSSSTTTTTTMFDTNSDKNNDNNNDHNIGDGGCGVVGAISVNTSIAELIQSCVIEATQLCDATYLIAPPVTFVTAVREEEDKTTTTGEVIPILKNTNATSPSVQQHREDTESNEDEAVVTATFVRSWLQYTLIEVLKNSMAATIEQNSATVRELLRDDDDDDDDNGNNNDNDNDNNNNDGDDNDNGNGISKQEYQKQQPVVLQLPYVYVHLYDDKVHDAVVIRVLDQGGGICDRNDVNDDGGIDHNSNGDDFDSNNDSNNYDSSNNNSEHPQTPDLEDFFTFAQRTTVYDRMNEQQTYAQVRSPLQGLGTGLALSRWHMRHFGGDLTLENRHPLRSPSSLLSRTQKVINSTNKSNCDDHNKDEDDSYINNGSIKRKKQTVRICGNFTGVPSDEWHTLEDGMTTIITIPKNDTIPIATTIV